MFMCVLYIGRECGGDFTDVLHFQEAFLLIPHVLTIHRKMITHSIYTPTGMELRSDNLISPHPNRLLRMKDSLISFSRNILVPI